MPPAKVSTSSYRLLSPHPCSSTAWVARLPSSPALHLLPSPQVRARSTPPVPHPPKPLILLSSLPDNPTISPSPYNEPAPSPLLGFNTTEVYSEYPALPSTHFKFDKFYTNTPFGETSLCKKNAHFSEKL